MLVNCHQTKNTEEHKKLFIKPQHNKQISYQNASFIQSGFDDFLSRITAMKEQGNLIISGIRIC